MPIKNPTPPLTKMKTEPNELDPSLLNVNSLQPYPGTVSASRGVMLSSHLSQKLVIAGSQTRYIMTGMEREFGKYTFSIKAPTDIKILKTIDRYRKTVDADSIEVNPQTIAIFEDVATKQVGVLDMPNYFSYHQYFGFEYKTTPARMEMTQNKVFREGTIFANSPAIDPQGNYNYGIQLNVAYMSHPAVSEDGAMVSRDILDKLRFKTFERRVGEWGGKKFPLNTYGTHTNFKAFPDIGERVREDGILMMFRTFDPLLAPVEQSIYDVTEPDSLFDEKIYAPPGGLITDIIVYRDHGQASSTPELMEKQALKYANAGITFHTDIVTEWRKLSKTGASITPEFHRLVVESMGYIDDSSVSKIKKLHRNTELDDVRIAFVIESEITPDIGFKITDTAGGKAVICHIAEPHEMPVDSDGNRADVVMDGISTVNRMNIARLYEQYINAASRDVLKHMRAVLGIPKEERYPKVALASIAENNPKIFDQAYNYLLGYYKIVSPKQYEWMAAVDLQGRIDHVGSLLKDFIYIFSPPNNSPELVEVIQELEKDYRPTYGPVSYIGFSGNRVVTKSPVRVGSCYFMLLEKIGDDWSSVSSGRLHHFGFLAPVGRGDKFSEPIRNQPVRANGEAETRIFVSTAGPRALAEIMDRNGSPLTHQAIVQNILSADKPSDLPLAVDRDLVPLGGSKPLQLLEHITFCSGWRFVERKSGSLYSISANFK